MWARIVERRSGAVVGRLEAASSYELFQALLDWGEAAGLARFKVPALYRTEREPAPAPPAVMLEPVLPGLEAVADAPIVAVVPRRRRSRRRSEPPPTQQLRLL